MAVTVDIRHPPPHPPEVDGTRIGGSRSESQLSGHATMTEVQLGEYKKGEATLLLETESTGGGEYLSEGYYYYTQPAAKFTASTFEQKVAGR